jgi:hypothetical protein
MFIPMSYIQVYLGIALVVFIVMSFLMYGSGEIEDFEFVIYFSFLVGSNWFFAGIGILWVYLSVMIRYFLGIK